MINILNKIDKLLIYVSSFALFIMMLLIFVNAISRFVLNKPITGVIEFTGEYLMVAIVYLALSFTHKNGNHVNVEILYKIISQKTKKILQFVVNVLSLLVFILLTYSVFHLLMEYIQQDIHSMSNISYPLAPAVLMILIGLLLMCLRIIAMIFNPENISDENPR